MGLVALYGLNELVYRLTRLVVANQTNLNDTTISAQIEDAPHMTLLIVIFLAPFVEEVLFRGLVFGNLRRKSAAVKKKFQLLHHLERPCDNEDELLDAALAAHPRKIVIKRPPKGPWLAGAKPSHSLAGKAVRYDVIVPPRG